MVSLAIGLAAMFRPVCHHDGTYLAFIHELRHMQQDYSDTNFFLFLCFNVYLMNV